MFITFTETVQSILQMIKDIVTTMYKLADNFATFVEIGKYVVKLLFNSRNIGLGKKPIVVDYVRKEIGGGGVFEGDSAAVYVARRRRRRRSEAASDPENDDDGDKFFDG